MNMHRLTLIIALALSVVSAYFSIAGMMAIFASAAVSVAVMASALELCKIIGASWLYRNWTATTIPIKSYLSGAVIVLVLISSLGIFGYLSKAHIEQGVAISSSVGVTTQILQVKIDEKNRALNTSSSTIQNLDDAMKNLSTQTLDKNATIKAKQLTDIQSQKSKAIAERDVIAAELTTLLTQKAQSNAQEAKMEAEVGPLKYIAEAVYGNSDKDTVDRAVRWVIMIIVMVFDPLAICLLIAANDGMLREQEKNKFPTLRDDGIVEINHSNIREM